MNSLITYIYESGISMAALYGIYWVFFRNETYFRFNRFYLLGTIMLACLIPMGNFKITGLYSDQSPLDVLAGMGDPVRLQEVMVPEGSITGSSLLQSWRMIPLLVYLLGFALLFARFSYGILRILKLRKSGEKIRAKGYSIIYIDNNLPPFSFFRNIFLDRSFMGQPREEHIIRHETIHIRQQHSIDNLILEICLVLFWYNPFVWLIKRSLRNTHEYLADLGVKKTKIELGKYQSLLLEYINGMVPITVTNSFNSAIKNRIQMMFRSRSSTIAKCKTLLAVPVLLHVFISFACSEANNEDPSSINARLLKESSTKEDVGKKYVANPDTASQKSWAEEQVEIYEELGGAPETEATKEPVFFIVEEMPKFQGVDIESFRTWIGGNLEYPREAARKGINGVVFIQFIVNSEGKVENVKVVRGVDPLLDAEAVRVIGSSPFWEPGKQRGREVSVAFTFPVVFALD